MRRPGSVPLGKRFPNFINIQCFQITWMQIRRKGNSGIFESGGIERFAVSELLKGIR